MSAAAEIRFCDIPSKLRGSAWSSNTWKIRYVLNYKNLPYKTIWIEYSEIASTCQTIGAPRHPQAQTAVQVIPSPSYTIQILVNPYRTRPK
ncbi:hypothetical protein PM082_024630 [Marasmius tenuissimus]|nr:hypothetical protein PM082_024630 [Marasmius tenuissimus]